MGLPWQINKNQGTYLVTPLMIINPPINPSLLSFYKLTTMSWAAGA
jgi:hypothetical protein